MNSVHKSESNPLAMFMRQPKIYIKFPSGGSFWPDGSLALTENGEYPVFSMTAKDELALKIPDALMNGQAVVDVIQHCIPNIKNAWDTPNIDIDLILIAIRLATYGEMMSTPLKFGEGDAAVEFDYQIDLRLVMDTLLNQVAWDEAVPINDEMTVFVKPLNYRHMSASAITAFETQKIMQMVNDDTMSDEKKLLLFQESFKKLSDVTIGSIENSISRIDTIQGSTDDVKFIKEFINNSDKEIFNKIQKRLEALKDQNSIKPIIIEVTDQMREQGITGDTVEIPLTFDPSTFFV